MPTMLNLMIQRFRLEKDDVPQLSLELILVDYLCNIHLAEKSYPMNLITYAT